MLEHRTRSVVETDKRFQLPAKGERHLQPMNEFTNTLEEEAATGATDAATATATDEDGFTEEERIADARFDSLWNTMNKDNAAFVPNRLQEAAGDLMLLALDGYNGLCDSFANETGEAVIATRAAIALARAALLEIEEMAARVAQDAIEHHRRELAALEAALDA